MNFISLSFAVGLVASVAPLHAAIDAAKVATGSLKGSISDGVVSFLGIPFAAPPVGDLRWRPPQPAASWAGVRAATEYGHDCMQLPFPSDAAPLGTAPSEDCLVLNIWSPAKRPAAKLPVMVWIYGGGYVNGGSSPAVYSGAQFAKRGILFVSFNYRLGRFGFFAYPALDRENPGDPHGNYGFMDQIAALQWVRRNIAAFGGDPANVTLFGESAGGGSVLTMMASPLSQGLFQKAIVESGGGRSSAIIPDRTIKDAEVIGVAFAKKAGVSDLAELRKLPAEAIVDKMNMATMFGAASTYSGPMIDGKLVVEPAEIAFRAGREAHIPVMIGANSADIGFVMGNTVEALLQPFSDLEKARAAYDPDGNGKVAQIRDELGKDRMMVEPARFIAQTVSAQGQTAYEYRFSYVAESMRAQWKGAPHATEIPFVFDTVKAKYGKDLTAKDEAIAQATNAYWAAFARSGNPNGAGRPDWPAYKAAKDILMDFTEAGPVAQADPWKARLDITETLSRK
jgi:para-nitrobenzyl esterase